MWTRVRGWPVWGRAALAVVLTLTGVTLLGMLGTAVTWWWLFGRTAPRDQPLDAVRWRAAALTPVDMEHNPRRDMARSVQRWVARDHPARSEVLNQLGADEFQPADGVLSYFVGCGFTSFVCMDEESLNVHFDAEGQAVHADFWQF